MEDKVKVLFVCHGNICRSPMAEFVLKDMVEKRGLSDRFVIASAATSSFEIGNPVHRGTQRRLAREGITCRGKTARRVSKDDYDIYDLIIGMDELNMRSLGRFYGKDEEGKIHKLLEFADRSDDVADPFFTHNFDKTYNDVVEGCKGLLEKLNV